MKPSRKLQLLEATIQNSIWRMHQARLGYAPKTVSCNALKGVNLLITIERARSSTEQFLLRQEKLQLAQDVGIAINQVLKIEIAKMLKDEFEIPILDCSILMPTSIESFSLWVAIDSEKMALSPSASQEAEKPSDLKPEHMTDTD